jgi:hypothetical protein
MTQGCRFTRTRIVTAGCRSDRVQEQDYRVAEGLNNSSHKALNQCINIHQSFASVYS